MNRLKELREERGLTVRTLGPKIGISPVSITHYENEKRDISTDILKKLSDYFEVTIDYLLCHSSYCLYAKYKEGNFFFKIKEDYYNELKEKKYIYFDNYDNRCIDLNLLIGIDNSVNVVGLLEEIIRIEKIDSIFEKNNATIEDFKNLDKDSEKIELTRGLIQKIKDAIR